MTPQPINPDDLTNRFAYHPPTGPDIAATHQQVRAICKTTAEEIVRLVPPGRECSLAVTAIEEAMMWANAGIARHQTSTTP